MTYNTHAKIVLSLLMLTCLLTGVRAEDVTVTILQTTDIHARIGFSGDADESGDWLRVASIIKRERLSASAKGGSLLIDCGDLVQGSLIGAMSRGGAAIQLLNHLQYDAWIPGNHELDFGVNRLGELLDACRVPVLNGNFTITGRRDLDSWLITERHGAKIAIIGMNSAFLNQWFWGDGMTGYTVVPALAQIETIMPRLMAKKPDMIILALHQGYIESDPRGVNEVAAIARGFPQIDLILCGHTHREIPGRRIGRSWVVQAGQHAQYLAKVTARIDTDRHRVTAIESELIPAAGESRDPEALTAVQAAVDAAAEYRRRKVCAVTNKISSGGMPGVDCHMSEVIARAIAWKTGAEVVFHGKLSTTSWPAGSDLTEGLLFDAVPYANGIGVADLTRDEIAEILEEQLQTRTRRAYNGLWGVQARADKKTGRVIDLKVPPGKRLTVAFNRYAIAGGGGRFPRLREILRRPGSRLRDAGVNSRDVLREYVRTVKGWDAPPHVWITFER